MLDDANIYPFFSIDDDQSIKWVARGAHPGQLLWRQVGERLPRGPSLLKRQNPPLDAAEA